MAQTTRLSLPYPVLADQADVPQWMSALAVLLDGMIPPYGQGTEANRPISTAGQPGIAGRLYLVTSTSPYRLDIDYGTGWQAVGYIAPGSIGTALLADRSVTEIKLATPSVGTIEIFDGAVTTVKLADLAVNAAKIAAALKPSQGASGATEALRAIGAGSGQVVAGDDTRLTDQRVPLDGSVTPAKIGAGTFNFPTLQQGGMHVARSSRGSNRHVEMGLINTAYSGFSSDESGSVSFVDPFASAPFVTFSIAASVNFSAPFFGFGPSSITGSGFSLHSYSDGAPGSNHSWYFMAEGAD